MKDKTTLSQRSFDKKALHYDNTFDGKLTRKFKTSLIEMIQPKEGDVILDEACGNGALLNALSQKGNVSCYGIDISANMIAISQNNYPHISFTQGDCSKTPYENDSFDIITVSASFHHFPSPEQFMKEGFRVLKPNGVFYIAEVFLPALFRWCINPLIRFSKAGDVKIYSQNEMVAY